MRAKLSPDIRWRLREALDKLELVRRDMDQSIFDTALNHYGWLVSFVDFVDSVGELNEDQLTVFNQRAEAIRRFVRTCVEDSWIHVAPAAFQGLLPLDWRADDIGRQLPDPAKEVMLS